MARALKGMVKTAGQGYINTQLIGARSPLHRDPLGRSILRCKGLKLRPTITHPNMFKFLNRPRPIHASADASKVGGLSAHKGDRALTLLPTHILRLCCRTREYPHQPAVLLSLLGCIWAGSVWPCLLMCLWLG
jgi:hypothetical protein